MFELIPAEYHPFVGVVGLAVLFIMTVSMIHRYREWQAEKMARAGRLLSGASALEQALKNLRGLDIPQELGDFCRNELVARYRTVQSIFPSMQGIGERATHAEGLRLGQGPWEAPEFSDEARLRHYIQGLSAVVDLLGQSGAKSVQDPRAMQDLREKILGLRAEAQYRYYAKASREAAASGDWGRAQDQTLRLMGFLKAKAPPNEYGKSLYQQAAQLYNCYLHQELPPQENAAQVA